MSAPARRRSDVAAGLVATWCAFCLVLGLWTGYELWQLAELGTTVADSGRALDSAGSALQSLGSVPVVGDPTAELGDEVRSNAADIVVGAGEAEASMRRLAVLIGLVVALGPSLPVLGLAVAVRRGVLFTGR